MNRVTVNADAGKATISKHIYGQFAESPGGVIYGGLWVGLGSSVPNTRGFRNDVLDALRAIKLPNVRWPGGAYAENYHWRDGIGPRDQRPAGEYKLDGGYREFDVGTHEFMDFCELAGCEPYLCCNSISGSAAEAVDWVRYLTADDDSELADLRRANGREKPWDVRMWAIGNEGWAYSDTPEPYAKRCLEYAPAMSDACGGNIMRVACGPGGMRYDWTDVVMRECGHCIEGVAFHHYTLAGFWNDKGDVIDFDEARYGVSMRNTICIEDLINQHSLVMDTYDPDKQIAIVMDEWGTWYDSCTLPDGTNYPPGQGTMRDAIIAATMLNMFNNHCERVRVCNLAMIIGALHPIMVIDTNGELFFTPSYHVFEMFTPHMEATMLPTVTTADRYDPAGYTFPGVNASASRDANGRIHLTLTNIDIAKDREALVEFRGTSVTGAAGRVLRGEAVNSFNTVDAPDTVKPVAFNDVTLEDGWLKVHLPAMSVVVLDIQE